MLISETRQRLASMLDRAEVRPGREFCVDLTRQFIEADDQDVMWQLRGTFHWTPSADTGALGSGDLWSFGMPLDDFFAEARCLPGFAWALGGVQAPRRLTVELDQI